MKGNMFGRGTNQSLVYNHFDVRFSISIIFRHTHRSQEEEKSEKIRK